MICRIRYVKIRPGLLEDHKKLASEWQTLVHKYGGTVLGFYYDKTKEDVIGIAEYESDLRTELGELRSYLGRDFPLETRQERVSYLLKKFWGVGEGK